MIYVQEREAITSASIETYTQQERIAAELNEASDGGLEKQCAEEVRGRE